MATILKAQLDAARTLSKSQARLADMVQQQVASGTLDQASVAPAKLAVATTTADIRQLELLSQYYADLEKPEPPSSDDDESLALELLKIRLEAAKQRLRFHTDLSRLTRLRLEAGEGQVLDSLQAQQAEATAAAEVQEFEALLRYHNKSTESQ